MSRPPTCAGTEARVPFAVRATRLVRKGWRAYWERRARRATVMLLHSLDARTLRDIGISPSEIESLIQCGDDRRRRYDTQWRRW